MLDPDVPHVERETDRPEPQPDDGRPLPQIVRPDSLLERQVERHREHRGDKAEAGDDVRRHAGEAPRQHRVARPGERAEHRGQVAEGELGLDGEPLPAGDDQHRAGETQQRPRDVVRTQLFARQQRREQHDEQRPEIVDEPGLDRRRVAQRDVIERVIAEDPAHAEQPDRPWLAQRLDCLGPHGPEHHACQRADAQTDSQQLERRHRAARRREPSEERPLQDRAKPDECGDRT